MNDKITRRHIPERILEWAIDDKRCSIAFLGSYDYVGYTNGNPSGHGSSLTNCILSMGFDPNYIYQIAKRI